MAFKMKTIPEVLGFNAEHSEQKSIVFETKILVESIHPNKYS